MAEDMGHTVYISAVTDEQKHVGVCFCHYKEFLS
jgi:hypothetical protein